MTGASEALQDLQISSSVGADTMADNEEEEELARFQPVLDTIRFDHLPDFALSLRARSSSTALVTADTDHEPMGIASSCKVVQPPLFGSYHILYILEFDSGDRWILRVPVTGHTDSFDEGAARSLRSEALKMKLISQETSIPIPKVHHFETSLENEIGCPFILMDCVEGINGQASWFDRTIDSSLLEERRARILRDVANAMQQLGRFTYQCGGSPTYDDNHNFAGIGPLRVPDHDAELRRMRSDDDDESPLFCEIGPFFNVEDFLLSSLNRREPCLDDFSLGVRKLLECFIRWLPPDGSAPPFVLEHPDFDIQNIVVKEDGTLAALIDWDGVASVPRCIGNTKLPSWLTRDWDPAKYAYGRRLDNGEPTLEDSPADLARYRSMYAKFILETDTQGEGVCNTGLSLLADNLYIAASDPMCTDGIVDKIFEECIRARKWRIEKEQPEIQQKPVDNDHEEDQEADKSEGREDDRDSDSEDGDDEEDEVFLYELVTELDDGNFNKMQLAIVKEGFADLCRELEDLDGEFWFSNDDSTTP